MEKIEQNEEEISLIDLFAVIIKYRKMIIFGTIAAGIIGIAALFVMPKLFPSFNNKEITATYSVKVTSLPRNLSSGLAALGINNNFEKTLTSSFINLSFIASEYKKFPFTNKSFTSDVFFSNSIVEEIVKSKKLQIVPAVKTNYYDVILRMPIEKLDTGTDFVKEIVSIDNESVSTVLAETISLLESNTKESLEKIEKSTAQVNDLSTIQNLRDLLKDIEMYKEKNINIFELEKEPFVLSIAQGRLKKLIIVVFAAFFLLVFLAFVRNAVLNIKADPEASKIISDAWNSGK
ncbi:MAG: hypothetical protein IIX56_00030 [Treponema sp.]|nr:hypothetical protein [Treponema sp.]MBR0545139.1 hypothetical protein [Treponema sp.]